MCAITPRAPPAASSTSCWCTASACAARSRITSATCRRTCARARSADDFNRQHGRTLQYQNGGTIRYVITLAGPEPLEARHAPIDYEHYLTRQLQPIADAILPFVGDDFTALTSGQRSLF
jgi:DNA polymerase elongation subunit (family B)